ncbi:MAG: TIGR04255 family protein [Planctomycetes bacterium]|nr:TIGR04255 family protein [Planctomycetota bacterium]
MSDSRQLPDYTNPPINEVILGVQFNPILNLSIPHLGMLWTMLKDRFPKIEQREPIAPVNESLDGPTLRTLSIEFGPQGILPTPRLWFLKDDGTELLQIQNDRILHNWRQTSGECNYPRYKSLREQFCREFAEIDRFLRSENLDAIVPNQSELTYINLIEVPDVENAHRVLSEITSFFNPQNSPTFGGPPESAKLEWKYLMPMNASRHLGRLHISFRPVFLHNNNKTAYVLDLTARGAPKSADLDGVTDFLDLAHEWIVNGFDSITTPRMHRIWGKK